jgi:hypothetical protein
MSMSNILRLAIDLFLLTDVVTIVPFFLDNQVFLVCEVHIPCAGSDNCLSVEPRL